MLRTGIREINLKLLKEGVLGTLDHVEDKNQENTAETH